MTGATWSERAACADSGIDPELFFPLSEDGAGARQVAIAKAVCARCPVAAQCLRWAVAAGEPAGIWGGTTTQERRLLRRRMEEDVIARSGARFRVIDGGAVHSHGRVSAAG